MSSKLLIAAVAGLAMVLGAGGASASTVEITITDISSDLVPTITFDVPEDPTVLDDPTFSYTAGENVTLDEISVMQVGSKTLPDDNITFYNGTSPNLGGLSDAYFAAPGMMGQQIYGGTEASPTFTPGDSYTGTYGSDTFKISISALTTTPLPSTWLMLLSGLVGLVCLARRRSSSCSPARAA